MKRPISENENSTQPNTAQPKKTEQTPSQEHKLNLENLKRIMNSEKITLPSLRNIDWRKVRAETNKVNQVLTYIYISMHSITKLDELIYAGAKLVFEKIEIPSKSTKKIKTRLGISTRNSDKKSTKTGKNDKTKERRWNNREQKRKDNTGKTYNTT